MDNKEQSKFILLTYPRGISDDDYLGEMKALCIPQLQQNFDDGVGNCVPQSWQKEAKMLFSRLSKDASLTVGGVFTPPFW